MDVNCNPINKSPPTATTTTPVTPPPTTTPVDINCNPINKSVYPAGIHILIDLVSISDASPLLFPSIIAILVVSGFTDEFIQAFTTNDFINLGQVTVDGATVWKLMETLVQFTDFQYNMLKRYYQQERAQSAKSNTNGDISIIVRRPGASHVFFCTTCKFFVNDQGATNFDVEDILSSSFPEGVMREAALWMAVDENVCNFEQFVVDCSDQEKTGGPHLFYLFDSPLLPHHAPDQGPKRARTALHDPGVGWRRG